MNECEGTDPFEQRFGKLGFRPPDLNTSTFAHDDQLVPQ
jgi:hypothetical protein